MNLPMPDWAINRAHGEYVLGAHLPTRDGRKAGNAHIIAFEYGTGVLNGMEIFVLLTDAGSELRLIKEEIADLFYRPEWVSDVERVKRTFHR